MKIILVSYNILHGHNSSLILKNIEFLISKGANIICLQEADLPFKNSLNKFLGLKLKTWKARYFHTGIACNLAIIWDSKRLILKDVNPILLPALSKPSITQKLIRSTQTYKRGALLARFFVKGKLINIINTHLGWEGGINHRLYQLKYLRDLVDKKKVSHGILSGDFNTFAPYIFRHFQKKKVEEVLGEKWKNAFPDLKWSCDISHTVPQDGWDKVVKVCRLLNIKMRSLLDYMFSQNMRMVSAETFDLAGSDHRPQLGIFEFN